jgi:thiol:disulfide interchange protein DsbD
MTLPTRRSLVRGALIFLVTILSFVVLTPQQVKAVQTSTDTVSTSGIEFTDIPTAADSIAIKKKAAAEAAKVAPVKSKAKPESKTIPKTLWQVFIAGFLGGFAAFLMPCIYPMLPLTVSFFTKKAGSRSKGIFNSVLYGLSIIFIYVFIGILVAVVFGPAALNGLATNGVFNFFFFLLLIVFGISFLGAFEITLPSSLANKLDENSDKGGLIGIFFMAATLVVVSFSCTGPIVSFVRCCG